MECIIENICRNVKQNAKICAIGETECNEIEVLILGGQLIEQKRKKGWWIWRRDKREQRDDRYRKKDTKGK